MSVNYEVRYLLLSVLVIVTNETDGQILGSKLKTPCKKYKCELIKCTSTGNIFVQI